MNDFDVVTVTDAVDGTAFAAFGTATVAPFIAFTFLLVFEQRKTMR